MRILPTLLFLLFSCNGEMEPQIEQEPTKPQGSAPEEFVARDGASIFEASCASCHGVKGDGQGVLVLDRKARSFVDGGFSFGNTHEAIFRTVTQGIGGTSMPAFGEVLSETERHSVTEYVISLCPTGPVATAAETVLVVSDRPVVVRGHLPSVSEGLPPRPRGLLLGGLDGLTWEYRVDDVRLLAVRQGDFVDRSDWGGRGGTPLKPLGKIIFLNQGGDPGAPWKLAETGEILTARLAGTSIRERVAQLRFLLLSQSGAPLAEVATWGGVALKDPSQPFRRHFRVQFLQTGVDLMFENEVIPAAEGNFVEFSR